MSHPWTTAARVEVRAERASPLESAVASATGSQAVAVALAVAVIGFGSLAVLFGQSNSWDLRNYHLYNGWAFWTGRGAKDFAAAQLQSYFNPLLATAEYLLFVNTPPWLSTFLLGVVQGCNLLPVHALTRRMLPGAIVARHPWLTFHVALVGCLGATQLGELGGSMGDNLVSLPVLCAFAVVLCVDAPNQRRVVAAGLLVGAATGLKLTAAPFALGLLGAIALLARNDRVRLLLAAALGAGAGFLAFDGSWMWHLYREFGNPFHPAFAGIFGGEFVPPVPMRDVRFVPQSLLEWLFYPLRWAASPRRVSDAWFLDLRIPLAFVVVPLALWRTEFSRRVRALVAALAVAYVGWLLVFDVYRYLQPIEMLAPLLVVAGIARGPERRVRNACVGVLAAMTLLVRPPGWGHLHPYGSKFLDVEIPALEDLGRATIVLAEDEPLTFLALGFPPGARFVRIAGNSFGPPIPPYAMDRDAGRRLQEAAGPFYALVADPASRAVHDALARQHLSGTGDCSPVRSNLLPKRQRVSICRLSLAKAD